MPKISIIGLGAGDLDQLPLGIYRTLKQTEHLYLRTKEHPVIKQLEAEGLTYHSYDFVYEKHDQFEDVYEEIVKQLIYEAKTKDIVYGVPGHPLVAEKTIQLLLEKREVEELTLHIEGGQSFIDPLFSALEIDPIEGFQLLDALNFRANELQFSQHIILCQVYDQMIASNVKLALMEQLPDDYEVYIVTSAGSKEQMIKKVPLYELDRGIKVNNLTSVYIPPVTEESVLYHDFRTFRQVIATLRGPGGCPWDQKQTHQSLKKYLLEEVYEVLEAIDNEDEEHMVEELGDVLLQIVLHSQIGEDHGFFSIDDVIRTVTEKMIRRHPHVFGETKAENEEEVIANWEEIKKKEKSNTDTSESILDSVPKSLPGVMKAYQFQYKAGKVGFDWKEVEPMWDKVNEEIKEFKEEIANYHVNQDKMIDEFGDILFALVNVARFYKIDPEEAITKTNQKFYRRFNFIEQEIKSMGGKIEQLPLDTLDGIWEKAKMQGL